MPLLWNQSITSPIHQKREPSSHWCHDQWLHMQIPVVMGGANQLDPAALKKFHDGIWFLDTIIADRAYAAGQHLTIADIALVASISSIDVSSCCLCMHCVVFDSETKSVYVSFIVDRPSTAASWKNICTYRNGSNDDKKRSPTTRNSTEAERNCITANSYRIPQKRSRTLENYKCKIPLAEKLINGQNMMTSCIVRSYWCSGNFRLVFMYKTYLPLCHTFTATYVQTAERTKEK